MKYTFVVLFGLFLTDAFGALNEEELNAYLKNDYEKSASELCKKVQLAAWDFESDINNKEKEEIMLNATLESAQFGKEVWTKYFKDLNPDDYKDPTLKRQIDMLKILGTAALDDDKLANLTSVIGTMTNIYSTAKICPYAKQNCDLNTEGMWLTPGIESVISKSRDYDELLYTWKAWHDATGAKIKIPYQTYVNLSNEAAVANNFSDMSEMWIKDYETDNFKQVIDALWTQIEPLYTELHTYVSNRLKQVYGDKLDISDGLLPAHVLGNLWAQEWVTLFPILEPYPNASNIDVTRALEDRNFTVLQMFQTADEFYQSLGLAPNTMSYDVSQGAIIEKAEDGREMLCHASAWDFCDGKTYRIKMCTQITFEDFVTIHHEMGHIQYFIQYKSQPYNFRSGANPGFHEAIGDTIALSVANPKHLKRIGLLDDEPTDLEKASINALMNMALQKVAFLPFGLLVDKWRWDVFEGTVSSDQWTSHWWKYREKYQKVKAPIPRNDETDFDPGAKYHVAADSQYIAYFVAHVLQFQFYKSLCISAGEYDPANKTAPLHNCDFYKSKDAGDKLKAGLMLGESQHWSRILEVMTGEKELNAGPLLEYFEPLYIYLKDYNEKSKI